MSAELCSRTSPPPETPPSDPGLLSLKTASKTSPRKSRRRFSGARSLYFTLRAPLLRIRPPGPHTPGPVSQTPLPMLCFLRPLHSPLRFPMARTPGLALFHTFSPTLCVLLLHTRPPCPHTPGPVSRTPLPMLRFLHLVLRPFRSPHPRSAAPPGRKARGKHLFPVAFRLSSDPQSAAVTKENNPDFIFYTPIFAYSIFLITFVPVSAEYLRERGLRPVRDANRRGDFRKERHLPRFVAGGSVERKGRERQGGREKVRKRKRGGGRAKERSGETTRSSLKYFPKKPIRSRMIQATEFQSARDFTEKERC